MKFAHYTSLICALSLFSQALAIHPITEEDSMGPQLPKALAHIESMKDYLGPEAARMFHFAPVPMPPEESAKSARWVEKRIKELYGMQVYWQEQAREERLKKAAQPH